MIALVRAEFLKLRTTQVWFWMLFAAVAVTALLVVAQIASNNTISSTDVAGIFTASATGYIVVFVLGVLGITTEFRYQTITPTVLTTPSRWALISAKMICYALTGAAFALISMLVQVAIAVPWLSARNVNYSITGDHIPAALFAVFLSMTLFGLVGMGFGALVKNQVVAVSVGVIFLLVLNRLLIAIPGVRYVYPYTPDGAFDALITVTGSRNIVDHVNLLPQAAGALVLILWAVVPAVIGAGLTMNRDIT